MGDVGKELKMKIRPENAYFKLHDHAFLSYMPREELHQFKQYFLVVTYDITYDIMCDIICDIIYQYYDIIVCVMISLVICDIMLGHMIS